MHVANKHLLKQNHQIHICSTTNVFFNLFIWVRLDLFDIEQGNINRYAVLEKQCRYVVKTLTLKSNQYATVFNPAYRTDKLLKRLCRFWVVTRKNRRTVIVKKCSLIDKTDIDVISLVQFFSNFLFSCNTYSSIHSKFVTYI